jgi:hypothetical protein
LRPASARLLDALDPAGRDRLVALPRSILVTQEPRAPTG